MSDKVKLYVSVKSYHKKLLIIHDLNVRLKITFAKKAPQLAIKWGTPAAVIQEI